jgi:hypothetical protein
MYNRFSTFGGNNAKTDTGSVDDINEPNTSDSRKLQPASKTRREKKYIKIAITKVEKNPPKNANPRMGIMF